LKEGIKMNELLKTIQNHRSIRNYLDKDISEEMINEILRSAQAMPNSINGQQISIIVVKDKNRKEKMAELAGGQPWISAAPVFLVFVMDFYKTSLAGEKTGNKQVIHESIEGTLVGSFDGGLAMGGAIIAAESLCLGIVPIGGIRNNPKEIIELLELPEYTYPLAGLAIGYPADNSHKKPRMPFETYKHEEKYNKEGLKEAIDSYDNEMGNYLKEVGREQEVDWSTQTSRVYKSVYFPKVYPTMIEQGLKNDK
jgi:FMN reductase [NAD(P)H]